jgi:hypothetical protein
MSRHKAEAAEQSHEDHTPDVTESYDEAVTVIAGGIKAFVDAGLGAHDAGQLAFNLWATCRCPVYDAKTQEVA